MAPKQQREIGGCGGVETHHGKVQAHGQVVTKRIRGKQQPTADLNAARSVVTSKEEATADSNAARSGATCKGDVGRHLEALVAASPSPSASESAPATEQRGSVEAVL